MGTPHSRAKKYISIGLALMLACVCGCSQDTAVIDIGVDPGPVPDLDGAAFSRFFSRWSAYTLALANGATDEGQVYTGLARFADDWQEHAGADDAGGAVYGAGLPGGNGALRLIARNGSITSGSVSYDAQSADVEEALAYMVACNALVYSLAGYDDPVGIEAVYNSSIQQMTEEDDGAMTGQPVPLNGYTFQAVMDSGMQQMMFNAIRTARS